MRPHALALGALAALAVGGCSLAGEPSKDDTVTWSKPGVPFTFEYPATFTKAPIDRGDTRGDVVGAVGLTKVDVVAVRRVRDLVVVSRGGVRQTVLGQAVTSELHPVPGQAGWALECQYTSEYRGDIRDACRRALRSIRPH